MIYIKAKSELRAGKKGVAVSCKSQGRELIVMEESIAIIRTIMRNLKKENEMMHLMVLEAIAENPEILTCEDSKEKIEVISEYLTKTRMN